MHNKNVRKYVKLTLYSNILEYKYTNDFLFISYYIIVQKIIYETMKKFKHY